MQARRPKYAAVVVGAGVGARAHLSAEQPPKQYRPIGGIPVMARSITSMLEHPAIDLVLPVIHADHSHWFSAIDLSDSRVLPPVLGRESRQGSVLAGLEALLEHAPQFVLIHDAARPFADRSVLDGVVTALLTQHAVVPAMPVTDTIKRVADGMRVTGTEDRSTLFAAQTPQGFAFEPLLSAHRRAKATGRSFTDDASIAEWAGMAVAISAGAPGNLKLTVPEDFAMAELKLRGLVAMETRVGTGFDVHPFEPGDGVWLAGVHIPYGFKLKGHSDADVALHALTDALYGALGEGDIGTHFPPSDPQWRGAQSSIFLRHAARLVADRGGRIVNVDLTLICEEPRIAPHAPAMREAVASACGIVPARVTIKATTSERLGFTGRGEGIIAMASASIEMPRTT